MSIDIVNVISAPSSKWYDDIRFYITPGYDPMTLDINNHSTLSLKVAPYKFIDNVIFQRNYDNVFLKCLENPEYDNLLFDMHARPVGGIFLGEITAHKVLRVGYYWPTLFKYAHTFV